MSRWSWYKLLTALLFTLYSLSLQAGQTVNIAVLYDGPIKREVLSLEQIKKTKNTSQTMGLGNASSNTLGSKVCMDIYMCVGKCKKDSCCCQCAQGIWRHSQK